MTISIRPPPGTVDLYAHYAQMRLQSPCRFDAASGCFVLTRFADVHAMLKEHDDFSSDRPIALKKDRIADGLRILLLSDDPPRHTHVRSLVHRWFTPKSIAAMATRIEGLAETLLEDSGAEVDFVQQIAAPLPIMTIATLLGVDSGEWRTFKRWSDGAAGLLNSERSVHVRDMISFFAFFGREIHARRESPRNDLITSIVKENAAACGLTDVELRSFCVLLFSAGSETTTNLLGNMLWILSMRPQLWDSLRHGRIAVPSVIEEALRFESPIQMVSRVARREAEVNGLRFAKGAVVIACIGAANRDPGEFAQPDSFDPGRQVQRHLAFGRGIHFCIGAALARLQAEILLRAMLRRYRSIRFCDGIRIESSVVRGFESLRLAWDAG